MDGVFDSIERARDCFESRELALYGQIAWLLVCITRGTCFSTNTSFYRRIVEKKLGSNFGIGFSAGAFYGYFIRFSPCTIYLFFVSRWSGVRDGVAKYERKKKNK